MAFHILPLTLESHMEQNEQNNGETTNFIPFYLFLGTLVVAVLALAYKALF